MMSIWIVVVVWIMDVGEEDMDFYDIYVVKLIEKEDIDLKENEFNI